MKNTIFWSYLPRVSAYKEKKNSSHWGVLKQRRQTGLQDKTPHWISSKLSPFLLPPLLSLLGLKMSCWSSTKPFVAPSPSPLLTGPLLTGIRGKLFPSSHSLSALVLSDAKRTAMVSYWNLNLIVKVTSPFFFFFFHFVTSVKIQENVNGNWYCGCSCSCVMFPMASPFRHMAVSLKVKVK